MKEHRIVTFHISGYDEPWAAFIFEPDRPEQTPEDYFAEYCGLMDGNGKLQYGETEKEAVSLLFARKPEKFTSGTREVFHKNSSFGKL